MVQESVHTPTNSKGRPLGTLLLGLLLGVVATVGLGLIVGGPWVIGKRGDLPLERIYGDFAVSIASRIGGGSATNPFAGNSRALISGREAYTGSCAVCHGATGDGRGVFGTATYPNATDLRGHDAAEKSDAQLFWIVKNGLNFTGMPGFGDQYSDNDVWALVTYMRALQDPSKAPVPTAAGRGGQAPPDRATFLAPLQIPPTTPDQRARADPRSGNPAARGAAIFFAQGCEGCHGGDGNAPGDLGLQRSGGPEAARAVREGRTGMPIYDASRVSDAEMSDLLAFLGTIGRTGRGQQANAQQPTVR